MKTNDLLIALLALIVGLALGWFIAGQNAQAPVAMAPGQGNTVVNNIYDYVPAASVNANVYDTQTGGVIGQEQGEAGACTYNNAGKLLCPGFANGNVTQCLDWMKADMAEENITDPDMLLALINSCVTAFDGIQLGQLTSSEIQGWTTFSGPRCEAIKYMISNIVVNCKQSEFVDCTPIRKTILHGSVTDNHTTQLSKTWYANPEADTYQTQHSVASLSYNKGAAWVSHLRRLTYRAGECKLYTSD